MVFDNSTNRRGRMADGKDRDEQARGHDQSAPGQGGGQGDTPAPKNADPQDYKNVPGNQS